MKKTFLALTIFISFGVNADSVLTVSEKGIKNVTINAVNDINVKVNNSFEQSKLNIIESELFVSPDVEVVTYENHDFTGESNVYTEGYYDNVTFNSLRYSIINNPDPEVNKGEACLVSFDSSSSGYKVDVKNPNFSQVTLDITAQNIAQNGFFGDPKPFVFDSKDSIPRTWSYDSSGQMEKLVSQVTFTDADGVSSSIENPKKLYISSGQMFDASIVVKTGKSFYLQFMESGNYGMLSPYDVSVKSVEAFCK